MASKCNNTFGKDRIFCASSLARLCGSFLLLLLLVFVVRDACALAPNNSTASNFLERCRVDCSLHRDFSSCGKYRLARWLNNVRDKEFSYGSIRIIRIPSLKYETILPKVPHSRAFKSGITDTLDFLRDIANDLLTKRAIVYTIDNSVGARGYTSDLMLMDEDELQNMKERHESEGDWRIFKKKKSLILPILILLNLFKLKLLLLPIFLGVHFIKKLLVIGSLIVPSILAHLKICKVQPPHQTYPHHTWATAAEGPVDYPTGFGHDDSTWAHRNDVQGQLGYQGASYYGYRNPYG